MSCCRARSTRATRSRDMREEYIRILEGAACFMIITEKCKEILRPYMPFFHNTAASRNNRYYHNGLSVYSLFYLHSAPAASILGLLRLFWLDLTITRTFTLLPRSNTCFSFIASKKPNSLLVSFRSRMLKWMLEAAFPSGIEIER